MRFTAISSDKTFERPFFLHLFTQAKEKIMFLGVHEGAGEKKKDHCLLVWLVFVRMTCLPPRPSKCACPVESW